MLVLRLRCCYCEKFASGPEALLMLLITAGTIRFRAGHKCSAHQRARWGYCAAQPQAET